MPHNQRGMAKARGKVIRFPTHRRWRGSLAVLGGYGQVCELERAQTRFFWACVGASVVVSSGLQAFALLFG
jgi:hypothetical protein